MRPRKVCLCKNVDQEEIKTIIENGEHRFDKIIQMTKATTGCGTCLGELNALVRSHSEEVKRRQDVQKELPLL